MSGAVRPTVRRRATVTPSERPGARIIARTPPRPPPAPKPTRTFRKPKPIIPATHPVRPVRTLAIPGLRQNLPLVASSQPVPSVEIVARAMVSGIDPQYPVYGIPTTSSVRDNFQAAKDEIEELQDTKLSLTGGTMSGPIGLTLNQLIDGDTF
jgi:hypothetical protein